MRVDVAWRADGGGGPQSKDDSLRRSRRRAFERHPRLVERGLLMPGRRTWSLCQAAPAERGGSALGPRGLRAR